MSAPIKRFSLGKIQAALFEGESQGKKTYSFKFQKSYMKDNEWKNTEYFFPPDLRELAGLCMYLMGKQVRETVIETKPEPEQSQPTNEPDDLPF